MAITDILKTRPEGSGGFTCPHYEPVPGSKRCRHYLKNGACARPDEFMCVEWLKVNGHRVPEPAGEPASESKGRDGEERRRPTDLFGNPLPEPPPAERTVSASPPPSGRASSPSQAAASRAPVDGSGEAEDAPLPRGLTTDDIESFKALGVEVCLRSEAFGEIWLVPRYTGKDRKEITPEHVATICRVIEAFPGSRVVAFDKRPQPDPDEKHDEKEADK